MLLLPGRPRRLLVHAVETRALSQLSEDTLRKIIQVLGVPVEKYGVDKQVNKRALLWTVIRQVLADKDAQEQTTALPLGVSSSSTGTVVIVVVAAAVVVVAVVVVTWSGKRARA